MVPDFWNCSFRRDFCPTAHVLRKGFSLAYGSNPALNVAMDALKRHYGSLTVIIR